MSRTVSAVFELTIAGLLWGFGFIAAKWVLADVGPFHLTAARFVIASLAGVLPILIWPSLRSRLNRRQLRLALWPGVFLVLTLVLQTWGLTYTTATKSGFITCLYVLIVPLLERWILKRRLHRLHPLFVVLALIGTALICDFNGGEWNRGDLLTLLCAVAASFQILWFGLISERIGSAYVFNVLQTAWAGVLALPFLAFETSRLLPVSGLGWAGLLTLCFGSTLIAFCLQIRAQRNLTPSIASLLFLLESPFATLFAITLLGETLGRSQWLGAGLILVAVAAATYFATRDHETATPH